jgi:hypothetical protein
MPRGVSNQQNDFGDRPTKSTYLNSLRNSCIVSIWSESLMNCRYAQGSCRGGCLSLLPESLFDREAGRPGTRKGKAGITGLPSVLTIYSLAPCNHSSTGMKSLCVLFLSLFSNEFLYLEQTEGRNMNMLEACIGALQQSIDWRMTDSPSHSCPDGLLGYFGTGMAIAIDCVTEHDSQRSQRHAQIFNQMWNFQFIRSSPAGTTLAFRETSMPLRHRVSI